MISSQVEQKGPSQLVCNKSEDGLETQTLSSCLCLKFGSLSSTSGPLQMLTLHVTSLAPSHIAPPHQFGLMASHLATSVI
jgi:hypothetical protein